MSDYEDTMLDEGYEYASQEDLTPEEVFKMVLINKAKNTSVRVELQDKDGDTVDLAETVEQLIKYINDKMQDSEGNDFVDQIMPLMTQSLVSGLGRILGLHQAAFYLCDAEINRSFTHMMCISFLLLKFVQQKGLLIHTYEEPMTEEEIASIERKSQANNIAMIGMKAGQDPRAVLREMVNQGMLTEEDLQSMLGEDKGSDDDN